MRYDAACQSRRSKLVTVADFDGIIPTSSGLLASFALGIVGYDIGLLAVMTSGDFGQTWSSLKPVLAVPGNFLGCPALTSEAAPPSEVSLLTTIVDQGIGHIYTVHLSDGGAIWGTPNQLAEVPATCTGD
jgi:hypothetical protein